jgi:hypothetical protein
LLFLSLGLFVILAVWGTFCPPLDDFVRCSTGAFEITSYAGQIYCMMIVRIIYAVLGITTQGEESTLGALRTMSRGLVNATEAKASVLIPLSSCLPWIVETRIR